MVNCLNILPSKNVISNYLSPAAIILGSPNPDYNKLIIMLGSYTQVHIVTTNNKNHRTVGSIVIFS